MVRQFIVAVKQYKAVFTKRLVVVMEGRPYVYKEGESTRRAPAKPARRHTMRAEARRSGKLHRYGIIVFVESRSLISTTDDTVLLTSCRFVIAF